MKQWWEEWREYKIHHNDLEWWEMGKLILQENTIYYSTQKNNRKNAHISSLRKRLRNLEKKSSPQNYQKIKLEIRTKMKIYEEQEAKCACARAKLTWEREGEKCTKFFLSPKKTA